MKKIITATLLSVVTTSLLVASEGSNKKLALVTSLPHPMKTIMSNMDLLEIDEKQTEALTKVLEKAPEIMHAMFDKARELEIEIQKAVIKEGKTKEDLKEQLDALEKLKREITDTQIDTLNELHTILNKKQLQKVYSLMQEQKNK